jgi:hypothetical protein
VIVVDNDDLWFEAGKDGIAQRARAPLRGQHSKVGRAIEAVRTQAA